MLKSVECCNKVTGKIPLDRSGIVVSGGRGLKGPENWGMIEELAELPLELPPLVLNLFLTWNGDRIVNMLVRPGLAIKPNLYIAIGISGAIQHLAGVGSSKVICVINTDPEAPIFQSCGLWYSWRCF